jgi:hypothetical protein
MSATALHPNELDESSYGNDFEKQMVTEYIIATRGIPDCFDMIGDDDTTEHLVGIAPLLTTWWEAIDALDSQTDYGTSPEYREYLRQEVTCWFTARHDLLLHLAINAGIKLPRPDHSNGDVETSNHSIGGYGFYQVC